MRRGRDRQRARRRARRRATCSSSVTVASRCSSPTPTGRRTPGGWPASCSPTTAGVRLDERLDPPIAFHAPGCGGTDHALVEERRPTAIFAANNTLAQHAWQVICAGSGSAARRRVARRLRRRAVDGDGRAGHHGRRAADVGDGPQGGGAAAAGRRSGLGAARRGAASRRWSCAARLAAVRRAWSFETNARARRLSGGCTCGYVLTPRHVWDSSLSSLEDIMVIGGSGRRCSSPP